MFPFIPPSIPLTFFGTRYFYPHAGRISLVTALKEKGAKAGRESRTDQRGGDRLVRGRGERVSGQRLCVFGRWGSPDRSGRRPLVSLPAHEKKGGLSGELTSPAGLGKKRSGVFFFFFFLPESEEARLIAYSAPRMLDVERGGLDACGFATPQDAGECSWFYPLLFSLHRVEEIMLRSGALKLDLYALFFMTSSVDFYKFG